MLLRVIPLLHVKASIEAEDFYCDRLGFSLNLAHRGDDPYPCYLSLARDEVELHLSSLAGDGVVGGVANVVVNDVNLLHRELVDRGCPIDLAPIDQTWGSREMYVKDPDGNCIRFQEWPDRRS